jgi:hypothetical protein
MTPRAAQLERLTEMAYGVPTRSIDARPLPYWRNVHEQPRDTTAISIRTAPLPDLTAAQFIPDYAASWWRPEWATGAFSRIIREAKANGR